LKKIPRSSLYFNKVKIWIQNFSIFSNHNNILPLDLRVTRNNFYIISELLVQGSLRDLLCDQIRIHEKIALSYLKQIAEAMNYAHKAKCLHLGLKPENIMLKEGTVEITDFCMAELYQHSLEYYEATKPYMAPECLKTRGKTEKCDVWSTGIIFFEMLYGKTPSEIRKKGLVFPEDMEIEDCVKDLLRGMLELDKTKRLSFELVLNHEALKGL